MPSVTVNITDEQAKALSRGESVTLTPPIKEQPNYVRKVTNAIVVAGNRERWKHIYFYPHAQIIEKHGGPWIEASGVQRKITHLVGTSGNVPGSGGFAKVSGEGSGLPLDKVFKLIWCEEDHAA